MPQPVAERIKKLQDDAKEMFFSPHCRRPTSAAMRPNTAKRWGVVGNKNIQILHCWLSECVLVEVRNLKPLPAFAEDWNIYTAKSLDHDAARDNPRSPIKAPELLVYVAKPAAPKFIKIKLAALVRPNGRGSCVKLPSV